MAQSTPEPYCHATPQHDGRGQRGLAETATVPYRGKLTASWMAIPSPEPRRHETGPGNSAVYEPILTECAAHIPGALAFATVRGGGVPLTVSPSNVGIGDS